MADGQGVNQRTDAVCYAGTVVVGKGGAEFGGEVTDEEEKAVARGGGAANKEEVAREPARGGVGDGDGRRVEGVEQRAAVEEGAVDAARVGRVEMDEIVAELAQRGSETELGKHVGVLDLGEADHHRRIESHEGFKDVVTLEVEATGGPMVCPLRGEGVVVGQRVVAGIEEVFDIPKGNPRGLRLPNEKGEKQRQEGE